MERRFKHVAQSIDYLMSPIDCDVSDISNDEPEIWQLPTAENERISEEDDIDDNRLCPVIPAYVCGSLCLFSKRLSIAKINKETVTEPTSWNNFW